MVKSSSVGAQQTLSDLAQILAQLRQLTHCYAIEALRSE